MELALERYELQELTDEEQSEVDGGIAISTVIGIIAGVIFVGGAIAGGVKGYKDAQNGSPSQY